MTGVSQRFALRAALFSIVTALAATALVAGVALIRILADGSTANLATAEAVGKIGGGFLASDERAPVIWSDQDGHEHLTFFQLDEPEKWRAGQEFRLRYDPEEGKDENLGPLLADLPPDKTNVVSLEPGARNADTPSGWGYWWPTAVIGGVALLVLIAWTLRLRLNRAAAAATPLEMSVAVVEGRNTTPGGWGSAFVLLAPPQTPLDPDALRGLPGLPRSVPGALWQRVHWDPALDQIGPGKTVVARIKQGFGRRAVLEPRPGVRVWPAGRLTRKAPWGLSYELQPERRYQRTSAALRPPLIVWLLPVPAGLLGAARGQLLGLAPLAILGALILTTSLWSWLGPSPDD